MKINEITVEQLKEIGRTIFNDPFTAAQEDNELTEKLAKTSFMFLDVLPGGMAAATGIRIGLALAQAESLCDENGVPNVVVEDQVAS